MRNLFLSGMVLVTIFVFESCLNDKEHEENSESNLSNKILPEEASYYFEDNYFTENAYNQIITIDSLTNIARVQVVKTPTTNQHNLDQIDTLYEIRDEGKFFRFHKGEEYEILDSFSISTPNFKFNHGIKIGLSKQDFISKFSELNTNANIIAVGNNEKTEIFTFHFQGDSLKHIYYTGYVD